MHSKDIAFWNKIAGKYAGDPIQDLQAYEETLDRIKSYLTPQDVVLEIGCGTGSTALVLAPLVKSLRATDASETMIEIAQEKLVADSATNIEFLCSSLLDVGEGDEHYDVVLALNVLHLIHDFPLALRKVHSKLKPDGLFISKTICMPPAKGRFKFWLI
jgi:2-polyprenyl-3-methyl-5-hydroxy-6-metoxy-1,4-benzoquinol methylase